MNSDDLHVATITAVEARKHLGELEAERAAAIAYDVISVEAYRHDLDAEIEIWRRCFVTAAVTEIATLRAALRGSQCRLTE
jgi:hypothetical protein